MRCRFVRAGLPRIGRIASTSVGTQERTYVPRSFQSNYLLTILIYEDFP